MSDVQKQLTNQTPTKDPVRRRETKDGGQMEMNDDLPRYRSSVQHRLTPSIYVLMRTTTSWMMFDRKNDNVVQMM